MVVNHKVMQQPAERHSTATSGCRQPPTHLLAQSQGSPSANVPTVDVSSPYRGAENVTFSAVAAPGQSFATGLPPADSSNLTVLY